MACLVVGAYMPPVRLDLIRNLRHPNRVSCDDRDCRFKPDCTGNRLEILRDGVGEVWDKRFGKGTIRLHIRHGKNDRRKKAAAYMFAFDLPEGDLTAMLRVHIRMGVYIISRRRRPQKLFHSRGRNPLSSSGFSNYWKGYVMADAAESGVEPCCATAFRTLFVENFTCTEGGMPEELWEGAAIIMGNSVATWCTTYWPSMRRKKAELVIRDYKKFVEKHRASVSDSGSEQDDWRDE